MNSTIQRTNSIYASGGPQRDRTHQQGNILASQSVNQNILHPILTSQTRTQTIERDHIDLKIPLNRPQIPFGVQGPIEQTTDVLSAKTKIAELQKQQDNLRNITHRLSEELARYQAKYPPLSKEDQLELLQTNVSLPPWLYASEQMNPLLVAYDSRITEVEKQNALYKERINDMTTQIKTLVTENDVLNEKLAQTLMNKVKQGEKGILGDMIHLSSNLHTEEWRNMQERSRLLEEENSVLLEENSSLRQEVSRMREESKKTNASHSVPIVEADREKVLLRNAHQKLQGMQIERENALKQVQVYLQKVKQLQSQMNGLNSNLQSASIRNHELEQTIEGYLRQISSMERERDRYLQLEKSCKRMEFDLQEYRERMKILEGESYRIHSEREKLLRDISDQEQRLINHQTSEFEALQKLEQSAEMIENLRVEKESSRKQNESHKQEIERLEKKVLKMAEEHTEKCRQIALETHEKDQYTISSLREEIRQLQMEGAHIRSQIDRAEREKKNAESEVLKVIKAAESDHVANPQVIADLNRKIQLANSERDEAERMYENLRTSQKRTTLQWEQEREQLHTQISEHSKRMMKMERDLQEERDSNKRLVKEIDVVQKAIQNLEFEKQDQERALKEKITDLIETHKFQLKDLTRRVQESDSKILQTEKDYQIIQIRNEELETKYRNDSKRALERAERTINDLHLEVERLTKRNAELNEKMSILVKERADLIRYKEDIEKEYVRTRHQFEVTKSRADQNANTIRSLLDKEADLLRERKELHLQVDRKNMELERSIRDRDSLTKRVNDLNRSNASAIYNMYPIDSEEFEDKVFMARQGTSLPTRRRSKRSNSLRGSLGGRGTISSTIDV